ncbi:hypothetical protein POM88_006508 [Heracleum sosnowskyi]|uniref:Uncharacterized protein n=1 Tax=Heracleum sosnowskyi TaxID=360622 RepID=A0AAD8N027_9APIA|nr:hypothetical protein POM88_006508 [Heracleum sosnowskyi]
MVGKPKQPTYIPLELCSLVSLEHNHSSSYPVPGSYRLTTLQPAPLVEMSRQKPQDRMKTLRNALKNNNFADEPLLRACGVWVSFTQVEGRILAAPRLTIGNGEEVIPHSGRWNFNNKKLVDPTTITKWAVNFFVHYNFELLISDFIECGNLKGIVGSRQRSLISKYRASVRTQFPKGAFGGLLLELYLGMVSANLSSIRFF